MGVAEAEELTQLPRRTNRPRYHRKGGATVRERISGNPVPTPAPLIPMQEEATDLLAGPQRHTLLVGGSRSTKTATIMRAIVARALRAPFSRHVVFRFRFNAAWSSIALDTLPKVMRLFFPGVELRSHQQNYFSLPNGAEIWIAGLDDKKRTEKILGMEFATIFLNECSQIPYAGYLMAVTRLAQNIQTVDAKGQPTGWLKQRFYCDLNPVGKSHWTYKLFIRHVEPESDRPLPLSSHDDYRRLFMNPARNPLLTPEYLASLAAMPERQRRRFLEGEYVDEIQGALWTIERLDACRIADPDRIAEASGRSVEEIRQGLYDEWIPRIRRMVVAVDPSGASGEEDERSDEIGIVVAGRTDDNKAVVFADLSLRDGPAVWGRVAANARVKFLADRIVAEKNFGGAMVESTILAADRNAPVSLITASRGKHVRAEPVSALYETGKVMHLDRFRTMEDQLCNFAVSGYMGDRSPDRADALIWALTELMLDPSDTAGPWTDYYRDLSAEAAKAAEERARQRAGPGAR